MKILAIDPSGNWNEKRGKGKTGFALWHDGKIITAPIDGHNAYSRMDYWTNMLGFTKSLYPNFIICEEYILYKDKAEQQYWDTLDTPRFLGALEYFCFLNNIPIALQQASIVKPRWTNQILQHKGIITHYKNTISWQLNNSPQTRQLCDHELDAVRHLMHGITFNKQVKELIK